MHLRCKGVLAMIRFAREGDLGIRKSRKTPTTSKQRANVNKYKPPCPGESVWPLIEEENKSCKDIFTFMRLGPADTR